MSTHTHTTERPTLTRLVELRDTIRQQRVEVALATCRADDLRAAGNEARAVNEYARAAGTALGTLESIEHDLQLWLLEIGVR